jgi:aminoacylase
MEENTDELLAIERFVQYIQIKTVHPQPDYTCALEFLRKYAEEIQLQYSLITIDDHRHAAILTVG